MPVIDNISLSSTELDELELLVKAKRNGDALIPLATKRLDPHGDNEFPDRGLVQTYTSLEDKGLISGRPRDGAFLFTGLNQSGIDWLDDYEKCIIDSEANDKSQRKHDYMVATIGAIAGSALTLIAEHFTEIIGLLSSLLSIR